SGQTSERYCWRSSVENLRRSDRACTSPRCHGAAMNRHQRRIDEIIRLGLNSTAKFSVLVALAHRWTEKRRCACPAVGTIAKAVGLSVRQTQRVLRQLEIDGYITPAGPRTGGRARSVRYRLNLEGTNGETATRVT